MTRTGPINANKPQRWKADIAASVDRFNTWFLDFAPETFRTSRLATTQDVAAALIATDDLRSLTVATVKAHPAALATLRMCTAPPLAVDRLIGLTDSSRSLIGSLESGRLPKRLAAHELDEQLSRICRVLIRLLDRDIFPWLAQGNRPTATERDRAASIVADRLCSAVASPLIRNAQEQRQLELIEAWLNARGYRRQAHPTDTPLSQMVPGTFAFRMALTVGKSRQTRVPVDVVVQPLKPRRDGIPILIEAKSAGDFANTNKRRKEEAIKIQQLRRTYGPTAVYVLFLCGYFGTDYLGYEAAEGIDWIWEHRIADMEKLGL